MDLSKYPKNASCKICKTRNDYLSPLAICFECKKKFCFDHITCLQVNDKMDENDEVRDICDNCLVGSAYHRL
jgi:hypothetical protein